MVRLPDADAIRIDWVRVAIAALILATAIAVNISVNVVLPERSGALPFLALGVWLAILASSAIRAPNWHAARAALKGTAFLLSLVLAASMMPVERLPAASWQTTLGLGVISAAFDNIPLTALALDQGGYDWALLAYAVGFGGSMLWFGSSAGVAASNLFPQARSVGAWARHGWHIALAYLIGFFAYLTLVGWRPNGEFQ
jgi:hypothetical protein